MILIIEGLDRCGKSTLVSNLRKHFFTNPKLIVHHSSSPPKVPDPNEWEVSHYKHLANTFHELSYNHGYDIICDRFHLGAIVYGTKYRNINPTSIFSIDRFHLAANDTYLVLLTDNIESIMNRDDGNSLETSVEEFDETKSSFIDVFKESKIKNKIHINITNNGGFSNTYPSVCEFIMNVEK